MMTLLFSTFHTSRLHHGHFACTLFQYFFQYPVGSITPLQRSGTELARSLRAFLSILKEILKQSTSEMNATMHLTEAGKVKIAALVDLGGEEREFRSITNGVDHQCNAL